jgi:hypothetical protein
MKNTLAAVILMALGGGCAPRLEGAYVDVTGAPAFMLRDGKYVQPVRASRALPYKVDGAVIIVGTGTQAPRFTILPGGALQKSRNGQVYTLAAREQKR